MFRHLILGLLRDGKSRHGYELVTEYRARAATKVNTGNFYRELQRLSSDGLVNNGVNPPDADPRRIPYQITERGRGEFDRWLLDPSREGGDLSWWVLFIDRVPPEVRDRILDGRQEELWLRSKALTRAREKALERRSGRRVARYDPLAVLISRQLKQVSAELEFLEELRVELHAWAGRGQNEEAQRPGASSVVSAGSKRDKGVLPR